jgi:NAD(P)H dehydrogenase (quinone)
MYVVAGATGHTGRVAAEALLSQGKQVTVILRSAEKAEPWHAKGAKVAVSSLEDTAKMRDILAGAEGAYLLIPPNYQIQNYMEDRKRLIAALAEAVDASRIEHVVLMSSSGGHLPSGTGLILVNHMGEEALGKVARNLTILRPGSFVENWTPVLGAAKTNGVLPSFHSPQHKLTMIATADVGRFAAVSLLDPAHRRRILNLAGPQEYSPEDIGQILAEIMGREMRVMSPPMSAMIPVLVKQGFSEDVAKLFQEMYGAANSGKLEFETEGAEFRRGTITPGEVFRKILSSQAD